MPDGETREQRIARRLAEIRLRPDFPGFSEHIQRVMRSAQDEDASVRRITSIILRDYSLTLKLLRAANSPLYNRSGRPIHSVAHAVALLGLDAVRHLAGSLVLFEHYRGGSPGLKELMLLSLLSANHAYHASVETGYPRFEEAYICGMCRNLGEVLVACYFPRDYAALLIQMKDRPVAPREAAMRVFGFTLEELGQSCARLWSIPDPVARSIQIWEPMGGPQGSVEQLNNITAFAHGLTTAIYRREPAGARTSVRLLVDTYRSILGLNLDAAQRIAERSIRDTKDTFTALCVPLDDLRLRHQMETALALADRSPMALDEDEFAPREETLLERLTQEVEHAVAAEGSFDLNGTLTMVLEAISRGAGFDRAAFCLVNPERTRVQARLGLGEDIDSLLDRFHYPVTSPGSPIALALALKQDLIVDGERDGRFEHTELMRTLKPASFGLLPVIVDGLVVGCLYFDKRSPGAGFDGECRKALGSLRDLAARAISRARPAARPAATLR